MKSLRSALPVKRRHPFQVPFRRLAAQLIRQGRNVLSREQRRLLRRGLLRAHSHDQHRCNNDSFSHGPSALRILACFPAGGGSSLLFWRPACRFLWPLRALAPGKPRLAPAPSSFRPARLPLRVQSPPCGRLHELRPNTSRDSRRLRAALLGGEHQRNLRAPFLLRCIFFPGRLSAGATQLLHRSHRHADRHFWWHGVVPGHFRGRRCRKLGFRRALSAAYLILAVAYFLIGSIGASWLAPIRGAVPLGLFVGFILILPALGISLVKPCVVGTTARASKESVRSLGYSIYYTMVNIG